MRLRSGTLCVAVAGLLLTAADAQADNAAFQTFFFTACGSPTGALATRCAETPAGLGNLSGDSESSLNPSQNLSHNQAPVSVAQTRSKEARERGEKLREGGEDAGETAVKLAAGPFSLLINVHGTDFDRKVDSAAAAERGFEGDSLAGEIGFDYRASDRVVLGAIAGIERTDYEFDPDLAGVNFAPAPAAGDGSSDNTYLTLFGSFALGSQGFVEISAGYEVGDGSYTRNPVFQESTRTVPQTDVRVSGQADGTVTWVSLNAGFDVDRGPVSFGPYAGVTRVHSTLDGYTERDVSGSGLHMSFGDTSRDSLLAHAGVRISRAFSTGNGVFVPQLRVEAQHEFEDDPQQVTARFVLDSSNTLYTMTGGSGDKDSINAGFSVSAVLKNGWMPFLDYAILLGNDGLDRQRATLGVRIEF